MSVKKGLYCNWDNKSLTIHRGPSGVWDLTAKGVILPCLARPLDMSCPDCHLLFWIGLGHWHISLKFHILVANYCLGRSEI